MSTDRDTTRIVRSWLRVDDDLPADHILDAVLERVDTTPQRRATRWPAREFPYVSNFAKVAMAAAAVLALAFVGLQLLPGGGTGGLVAPSASATASPSPSPSPTPGWPSGTLGAGRQSVELNGVRFSFEVPAGWRTTEFEGMIRYSPPSNGHWPWIGFLNPFAGVADDPCAASATPVGPTVDDFANGMTTIPGTDASEPSDTTIGGVPAKFVELTINNDIACPASSFWLYGPDSAWPNSTGSTIRVWVFELDGTRYVIHSDQVGEDPQVGDMIVDVVESIEFD